MIPYGRQSIDDADIAAVTEVLHGDWLTTGPHVAEFEAALAAAVEAPFAVAFANGTAALHAAATVSGLGPGDVVATSALTFVASANCARYVGATPVLVDIDPATLNMDLSRVPAQARALVAVHYAGLPVDLRALRSRPEIVIEDACHALGAHTPDGPVGNCARSDMTVFSFHPVKAITTAEGGAVTTRNAELAETLRRFRSHGTVPDPNAGPWAYDVETLGFNYRLTDLQAALGTSQLRKLPRFLDERAEVARRYRERLRGHPIVLPPEPLTGFSHGLHLFPIRVAERGRVFDDLLAGGIRPQVHYVPIYHHRLYADLGVGPQDYPATETAYASLLSLPLYPGLRPADQDKVIDTLLSSVEAPGTTAPQLEPSS